MGWKDLLQSKDEVLRLPWLGGRSLRTWDRSFTLEGDLPVEQGWYAFRVTAARKLRLARPTPPQPASLQWAVTGYLVGDRLVPDDVRVETDPARLVACTENIHLVEPGLGRFARVSAGRPYEGGPLVFQGQEMPLGPEDGVLEAYLDRKPDLGGIRGVVPALDVAFRFETWRRAEIERRREEERLRREREEAERQQRERMAALLEQTVSSAARRELALVDFAEAARAALAVGGAEYLDHRPSHHRQEMVVQFRVDRRRYECTCDARSFQILDAGICLTSHETGEKGDRRFTLESLPGVIREAVARNKLVVWRHVD